MAIVGIDLSATENYQLSFDPGKGSSDATTWKIGTLDSRVIGRIRDRSTTLTLDKSELNVDTRVNTQEMRFEAVLFGVVGWDNFTDAKGSAIAYETVDVTIGTAPYKMLNPAIARLMPPAVIVELGERIIKANMVTEEDAKN